jgi:CBS domain-containing protein
VVAATSLGDSIFLNGENKQMRTAQDAMIENVVTTLRTAKVRDTIETLVRERMSGLPVVNEQGELLGIITEYALLEALYDENVLDESVESFMTRKVITVNEDTPLTEVADQVVVHRIRRLPVVRDGKVVGLIGRGELLKAALASGGDLSHDMEVFAISGR